MHLIFEDDFVTDFQSFVEAVVSHNIAGKAGITGESAGVLFFSRLACAPYFRTVGHNDGIGHMCFGRGVEDGDIDTVVNDIEYSGDEYAGLPADCLTGFQVDIDIVLFFEVLDERDQFFSVVPLFGDMVASSEIEPLETCKIAAEFLLEYFEYFLKCIGTLFAEGVKMKPVTAFEDFGVKIGQRRAEPRVETTWVVEFDRRFGVFRVDPKTQGEIGIDRFGFGGKLFELGR